jgi:glutamyl-Q tRNA(Asp) synthetase
MSTQVLPARENQPTYRGRFAPSPTGPLHFGSLVAALGSWLRARAEGGRWLVRIEDIDPPRERAGASQQILHTLHAFGLVADEAPVYQSARHALYREALQRLIDSGAAFHCTCTRSDLAPSGLHRGSCKRTGGRGAWRLRVPDCQWQFQDAVVGRYQQESSSVGDFVIWRADDLPAYQLAVVVDDDLQGISEVVRGGDLLDSTPRQIFLQQKLQLATPDYLHLPLALDRDGHKLSKSTASLPIDAEDPLPALRAALRFLGQPDPPAHPRIAPLLDAAVAAFDLSAIPQLAAMPPALATG